jgi:hypothetical protein
MRFAFAIAAIWYRHRHGMPRCSQFDTAGSLSPRLFATAEVPPKAWMISASLMSGAYSRCVNCVKPNVHA